ncbi:cupin domain-containing protein [Enterobacter bugandensis]|uniref:cupin domain-containing protein n=1 Tax=Enterobacter bugandensis TaxID=881260 RepID=UPI002005288D|nr:cupin domain-containing protein [Enterobacter bugandensis]MCK7068941.1 cupin domain-containing protein [Enterobacter bugandensis]
MMKGFYEEISGAVHDPIAGIRIAPLQNGTTMNSFGTRMDAGTKVSCHLHTDGDEWYSILDGDGEMYLADLVDGVLTNKRHFSVTKGDTFCITQNTAHQLRAISQLDFIFLCPDSHLGNDRLIQPDLI